MVGRNNMTRQKLSRQSSSRQFVKKYAPPKLPSLSSGEESTTVDTIKTDTRYNGVEGVYIGALLNSPRSRVVFWPNGKVKSIQHMYGIDKYNSGFNRVIDTRNQNQLPKGKLPTAMDVFTFDSKGNITNRKHYGYGRVDHGAARVWKFYKARDYSYSGGWRTKVTSYNVEGSVYSHDYYQFGKMVSQDYKGRPMSKKKVQLLIDYGWVKDPSTGKWYGENDTGYDRVKGMVKDPKTGRWVGPQDAYYKKLLKSGNYVTMPGMSRPTLKSKVVKQQKFYIGGKAVTQTIYKKEVARQEAAKIMPSYPYVSNFGKRRPLTPFDVGYVPARERKSYLIPASQKIIITKLDAQKRPIGIRDPVTKQSISAPKGSFFMKNDLKNLEVARAYDADKLAQKKGKYQEALQKFRDKIRFADKAAKSVSPEKVGQFAAEAKRKSKSWISSIKKIILSKTFKQRIKSLPSLSDLWLKDFNYALKLKGGAALAKKVKTDNMAKIFARPITDMIGGYSTHPKKWGKGFLDMVKREKYQREQNLILQKYIRPMRIVTKLTEVSRKRALTNLELKILRKASKEYYSNKPKIDQALKNFAKIYNKYPSENAAEFAQIYYLSVGTLPLAMLGGVGATAVGRAIGGTAKVALSGTLIGTAGVAVVDFLKNPSFRKFGETLFWAGPAIGSAKSGVQLARKLFNPNYRANVKNLELVVNELTSKLNKYKDAYKLSKDVKFKKKLQKGMKEIREGISSLKGLRRDRTIIKISDLNAQQFNTKLMNRIDKGSIALSHVSTQPKIKKLFGQKVPVQPKDLLAKVDVKSKVKGKVKTFGETLNRKKINQEVINILKNENAVVGGSYAGNIYVAKKYRRTPGDLDASAKSPKELANKVKNILNKKFNTNNFKMKKLPKAYRVTFKGKEILDLKKMKKGMKYKKVNGLKIATKKDLIKDKVELVTVRIEKQRIKKDTKDVLRLSEGSIKKKNLTKKNPSKVFEVLPQQRGMGKDRMTFSETHLYFDLEAPVYYAQGKPYSIIMFPYAKVNKFPAIIQKKISLARAGKFSVAQSNKLRVSINNYIKQNPGKFFQGPRTGVLPINEREWVLAVGSKFFNQKVYKTFDNDLRKFVYVVEVGFPKSKKLSVFRKLWADYKKKPFQKLMLRLDNPDIRFVRRYAKLLQKDLTVPKTYNSKFLSILKNMLKSKKGGIALLKEKKETKKKGKVKPKKIISKRKQKIKTKTRKARTTRRLIKPRKRTVKRTVRPIKRKPKPRKRVSNPRKRKQSTRKRTIKPRTRTIVAVTRKPKTRVRKRTTKPRTRKVRPTTRKTKPRIRVAVPKVRRRVRPIKKKPKKVRRRLTPNQEEKKKEKIIKKVITKKKFIYLPDLYSILYGVKATKGEKTKYLKKGAVFSGISIRKLVK